MTKYALITIIIILGLTGTLGCGSYARLDRLELQVDTLNNRLQSTQQELTTARESLIRAQERASYLEAQLQQAQKNTYTTASCPKCPEAETIIVSEPVYTSPYRYYPYTPYPYPPQPPYPPPHPRPPLPPPPHPRPPVPPPPPPPPPPAPMPSPAPKPPPATGFILPDSTPVSYVPSLPGQPAMNDFTFQPYANIVTRINNNNMHDVIKFPLSLKN